MISVIMIGLLSTSIWADTYRGIEFPQGEISFADEVVNYTQGTGGVSVSRSNPIESLGIPDHISDSNINYISLGNQGELILKFVDNSLTTSGDNKKDLWIFEVGDNEKCNVSISIDGDTWIFLGETSATSDSNGFDIDAFISSGVVLDERYSYVKIQDLLPATTYNPSPGADIDAVGAISSAPPATTAPIPGAMWLLGSGLLGLIGLRKRISK